jgi:thiol-disulfide isomerase/thioredoxin
LFGSNKDGFQFSVFGFRLKMTKLWPGLLPLVIAALLFPAAFSGFAVEKPINLYFFWSHGCPHCEREKIFLKKLEEKYPRLKIHSLEVTASKDNLELLHRVGTHFNLTIPGVPVTVVGEEYLIGWHDEPSTGQVLEAAVQKALARETPDLVAALIPAPVPSVPPAPAPQAIPDTITVPLWGEVRLKQLSLGLLTILFGALDGFNPCAMWVLVLLLGLLLGMENVRRRWILGSVFIAASALVYFLIMCAWLNLFLLLGMIVWVRIVIALVALAAGYYNLREYFTDRAGVCKITGGERRHRITVRIQEIIQKQSFWLALGGIILLAFAVNVVELICSAGLPVVYLQILSLTPLPRWQYYLYIVLYIFIFMLDDLLVFFGAMITFQVTGLSTRHKRWSNLIGGFIMLLIGFLLLFKPEVLMFG